MEIHPNASERSTYSWKLHNCKGQIIARWPCDSHGAICACTKNGISQNSNSQRKMHIHPLWYHLKTAWISSVSMFIPIYPEFLNPHQFCYLNFKEEQIPTREAQAGGQYFRNMEKNGINASPQSATWIAKKRCSHSKVKSKEQQLCSATITQLSENFILANVPGY